MAFNSLQFALFLPIFLLIFYAVASKQKIRDILLLIGSYIFYMSWYWQYAGLIALSTIIDYFIGRKLDATNDQKNRRLLLIVSIVVNLGILAVFKYYNFFYESSQATLAYLGINIPDFYHQLLLPVGISFYTFQTLSYSIDVYKRKVKYEKSFIKFAVFVSFFPQLVAGPIVRAKDFLPQINKPTLISSEDFEMGLKFIFIGLFKKIVIADLLAYLAVDAVFENPSTYSSVDLMLALYGYTFQIYCDFSGYSDIAIGIALLLGFKLPINFNRPYLAQSPSDFWRRWHISLSGWLRDYLYIPLGGNRKGEWITKRNLMITMLLGGLWHGAAINFLLWGIFHGIILVLSRNVIVEKTDNTKKYLKIFINFHLIIFSWLLFRISDMDKFVDYISGIFLMTGGSQISAVYYMILAFAFLMHLVSKNWLMMHLKERFDPIILPIRSIVYLSLLMFFVGASIGIPNFIYFQF